VIGNVTDNDTDNDANNSILFDMIFHFTRYAIVIIYKERGIYL
jgi:hypothetical protein